MDKTIKKSGAWLVRYALEQIGVKQTFGIPGVHNTEIYDELNKSETITPMLVTHEGGAAFMADAVSRTTDSIGTLMVVPAAGITHAASGIAEAHLDGIPMLVVSGGVRTDGMAYQLHDMDQHGVLAPITKATFKIEKHSEIVETFYEAYCLSIDGEPGPVFIEVPVNIALFKGECTPPPVFDFEKYRQRLDEKQHLPEVIDSANLEQVVSVINSSKKIGIFAGWGAKEATAELISLAEHLGAPVATTLQGLSVFPANHPLHVGMGFGEYAVPAAEKAFEDIDCLIAIGTRFSEIPTGSFGMKVPKNLIHVDINSDVFNANYLASISVLCDAKVFLSELVSRKSQLNQNEYSELAQLIQQQKQAYLAEWHKADKADKVNPARFFTELRKMMADDDYLVLDDGNHTFLSAELMPIHKSKHYLSPTDFNCMGYCVPAAIATKLTHPDKCVVGVVGDGAVMMTGMELITASRYNVGVIMCVFNDGELAQISHAQEVPYNRKTCTQLTGLRVEGIAMATGAEYIRVDNNKQLEQAMLKAKQISATGQPVLVDVNVDYSKKTRFTKGIVKSNLKRFEFNEKVRFISRAIKRKVTG
ncbi:MAG: thiamine pyrophosphate-binding protein [Parashewanella sp.]